jgi:carboxymethylenebutenolidase
VDIASQRSTLSTPDGPLPVYEAAPEGRTPRGGVIVLQELFGVTEYLEGVCRDLASDGWHAVAPHLFHRTGSPVLPSDRPDDARSHSLALTGDGILLDIDACLAHLDESGIPSPSVGALGFCMGGTLAFFVGTRRGLGATVGFYGRVGSTPWEGVPAALESSNDLRAPWLGLFGDLDAMIPVEDVERLRMQLLDCRMPTEVVRYPHADHAFHRATTPERYHRASAENAWARTLDWFGAYVPAPATVRVAGG